MSTLLDEDGMPPPLRQHTQPAAHAAPSVKAPSAAAAAAAPTKVGAPSMAAAVAGTTKPANAAAAVAGSKASTAAVTAATTKPAPSAASGAAAGKKQEVAATTAQPAASKKPAANAVTGVITNGGLSTRPAKAATAAAAAPANPDDEWTVVETKKNKATGAGGAGEPHVDEESARGVVGLTQEDKETLDAVANADLKVILKDMKTVFEGCQDAQEGARLSASRRHVLATFCRRCLQLDSVPYYIVNKTLGTINTQDAVVSALRAAGCEEETDRGCFVYIDKDAVFQHNTEIDTVMGVYPCSAEVGIRPCIVTFKSEEACQSARRRLRGVLSLQAHHNLQPLRVTVSDAVVCPKGVPLERMCAFEAKKKHHWF